MAVLPNQIADVVEKAAGRELSHFFRRRVDRARSLLDDQGEAFAVQGQPTPVAVSSDDAVFDLGGRHPNESFLATPVVDLASSDVTGVMEDTVGHSVTDQNSRAFLLTHRFLDSGASRLNRALVTTNCSGVLCSTIGDNDQLKLVLVDASGARIMEPGDPASVSEVTLDRSSLSDADLDAVYARDDGRLRRVPIRGRREPTPPYVVSDGFLVGGTQERLVLQSTRNPADVGTYSGVTEVSEVQHGKRTYLASSSYALPPADIGISTSYHGDPNAPHGQVWGQRTFFTPCSYSNRDQCLGCCGNIMASYVGVGLTTFGYFVTGGTIVLPGVGTIAGGIAGAMLGVSVALVGVIHSGVCSTNCDRLYDYRTGRPTGRRFGLTAVEYDEEGNPVAYEVREETSGESTRWSYDLVMQLVWGGADVRAIVDDQESQVRVVRRKGSRPYLRSVPDKTRANNLAHLPRV